MGTPARETVTVPASGLTATVAALFFCSGASGLVFELVWVKQLGLWVGHRTVAVSLVVSAFLTGLVLGSAVGGRWADRVRRPLRLYAALEAATGLLALGVGWLFTHAGASAALPVALPLRVALAFLVLLPPTFAMGATLPVLTRFVTPDLPRLGTSFGHLYSLNTLGAVAGCALAGCWWIGSWGLRATSLVAAGVNLAVALVALGWDRRQAPRMPAPVSDETMADVVPGRRLLVATALGTGFASIGCEVLWFRVLHSFVKSSTYAFTLLLVVFLAGLALGGLVYARRLAAHPRPWALLADVQSLVAFTGLLSVALLGRSGTLSAAIAQAIGQRAQEDSVVAQGVLAILVILVPAALMGVSYPLVARLGTTSFDRVGRSVGRLAAANTVGGALGSLVVGLWLIPALGTQWSFALVLALNALAALGAQAMASGVRRERWRRAAFVGLFVVGWVALPGGYLRRSVSAFPRARVLEVREGRDGTATVLAYDRASVCRASRHRCRDRCALDFSYRQLLFGTVSYASTVPPARRYMRALAHLPMLQHPRPQRVLEVCFGTGTTAGAFATYADLRALTLVDINEDVFGLARHFAASNRGVLHDPRVRRVVEDGRHWLATRDERYDVVSLEPPPPTAEGAATLYTREFYEQVRRRMGPEGILAQWIPLDQQTEALDRALLRSILDVFPEVSLYVPSRVEGVVLASRRPLRPDLARWTARWAAPAVRDNLAEVGFTEPLALLATLVLDTRGVRNYVADAPAVTDDLPAVEYYRSHAGPEFSLPDLLRRAGDPVTVARVRDPANSGRLRLLSTAERLMMAAEDHARQGDLRSAQLAAEQARQMAGVNPYTEYLAELEYECLGIEDP